MEGFDALLQAATQLEDWSHHVVTSPMRHVTSATPLKRPASPSLQTPQTKRVKDDWLEWAMPVTAPTILHRIPDDYRIPQTPVYYSQTPGHYMPQTPGHYMPAIHIPAPPPPVPKGKGRPRGSKNKLKSENSPPELKNEVDAQSLAGVSWTVPEMSALIQYCLGPDADHFFAKLEVQANKIWTRVVEAKILPGCDASSIQRKYESLLGAFKKFYAFRHFTGGSADADDYNWDDEVAITKHLNNSLQAGCNVNTLNAATCRLWMVEGCYKHNPKVCRGEPRSSADPISDWEPTQPGDDAPNDDDDDVEILNTPAPLLTNKTSVNVKQSRTPAPTLKQEHRASPTMSVRTPTPSARTSASSMSRTQTSAKAKAEAEQRQADTRDKQAKFARQQAKFERAQAVVKDQENFDWEMVEKAKKFMANFFDLDSD
ncbi:hypothetical protein K438DRAFT_2017656 [Mycena galopus ATCC 62051]|nr:hypothetical protein K438DRAFT_2017656 [Mycena galopus ATCC 62051]